MNFAEAMKREENLTLTTNGALAYKSTGYSKVLDLFAISGAMRNRTDAEIVDKMAAAFQENPLLTTRLLFYTGDVRQGLGERRTFRVALKWLANNHPSIVEANIYNISEYTRWDNIFELRSTPCEKIMVDVVRSQLASDLRNAKEGNSISLLAKWMPSEGASNKERIALARWFAGKLSMTPSRYRKTLAFLRAHMDVVEVKMSAGDWSEVDYSTVPSRAMTAYRTAFFKHDLDRMREFVEDVRAGRKTVKAGTLFPYDIVEKYLYGYLDQESRQVLELQWKALPNYIEGENNILVMADVSGSMRGRPMATSIGLAMYFAERNSGPYKDLFMTFSTNPEYIRVEGSDLGRKIDNMTNANWDYTTNLLGAFYEVLDTAIEHQVPNNQMPKAIVVISDMEIDASGNRGDFLSQVKGQFAQAGYTMPMLIYWNVNSMKDTVLTSGNQNGVILVSGQSPSVFKGLLAAINTTPYEHMVQILCGERYQKVVVPVNYFVAPPLDLPATNKTGKSAGTALSREQLQEKRRLSLFSKK